MTEVRRFPTPHGRTPAASMGESRFLPPCKIAADNDDLEVATVIKLDGTVARRRQHLSKFDQLPLPK